MGFASASEAPVTDVGSTTMPADLHASRLEGRHHGRELRDIAPLLHVPAPDIGMLGGQAEHLRTLGADHERDPTWARSDRSVLDVAGRVVRPFEVSSAVTEERDDDLDR